MEEKTLFDGLRAYSRGKITKDELEEYDETKLLYILREKTPRGESIVEINFDDDSETLKTLCVEEDDIWFLKSVSSSYSYNDFEDSYQMLEDFKQGYNIWWDLNEDNLEKAKEISKFILPGKEFDISNQEFLEELSEKLANTFPREIEDIVDDYTAEKNYEIQKTADQEINKELDDELTKNGFKFSSRWEKITTTVTNLIWLIAQNAYYDLNIKDMLNKIYCEKHRMGGWDENRYEYRNQDNFDVDGFNRNVDRNFDSILEKIQDNEDYEKYSEILKYISDRFKFGVFYELPKLPEKFLFRVVRVDFENLKIVVQLKKKNEWPTKTLSFDFENFKKFLYLPDLFDLSDIYSIE